MAEETLSQVEKEKKEVTEFIELLKTKSEKEKDQLKGIMIGMEIAKG